MKKFMSKIISVICVLCMILAVCPSAFAAGDLEVALTLDKTGKSAVIELKNVDTAIYSAQITLDIKPENASYTITPNGAKTYGVVKADN